MLGGGWHDWLVPHLNGAVRLHKPPLAYWLCAVSFKCFGVSTFAGRLPMVLAGWMMVVLVCSAGFSPYLLALARIRAEARTTNYGLKPALRTDVTVFVGLALTACLGMLRYARLAETDVLAALFTTVAMCFFSRGR